MHCCSLNLTFLNENFKKSELIHTIISHYQISFINFSLSSDYLRTRELEMAPTAAATVMPASTPTPGQTPVPTVTGMVTATATGTSTSHLVHWTVTRLRDG